MVNIFRVIVCDLHHIPAKINYTLAICSIKSLRSKCFVQRPQLAFYTIASPRWHPAVIYFDIVVINGRIPACLPIKIQLVSGGLYFVFSRHRTKDVFE